MRIASTVTVLVLIAAGCGSKSPGTGDDPQALRAQKDLIRQWEELPLKEAVDVSIGIFGRSFLTGEPKRLMQGFIDRKR